MISRALSAARLFCLLSAVLIVSPLLAQQDDTPPPPSDLPTETLHVYTNRMQFPTLLIDKHERSVAHPKLKDFDISLDSGKPFHPSGMHVEGDDPLAIAVLLDLSGGEEEIIKDLPDSLAALVPQSLHSQDHLYFYALDCRLIALPAPVAADASAIRSGLATISSAPVHGTSQQNSCPAHPRLWDAITSISNDLAPLRARHVLLVVSRTKNRDSATSRAEMDHAINFDGVSVFVVRDIIEYYADHGIHTAVTGEVRANAHNPTFALTEEAETVDLCLRSGGFVVNTIPGTLTDRILELITLLRGRYVLEFARPDKNFVGWHSMQVSVAGVPITLATGTSAPVADMSVLESPNTVPVSSSPASVGDRHILTPKNP